MKSITLHAAEARQLAKTGRVLVIRPVKPQPWVWVAEMERGDQP